MRPGLTVPVLLACACGSGEPPVARAPVIESAAATPTGLAESVEVAVPESAGTLQLLYDGLAALGGDRGAVRARWREPRATTSEVVPNVHDAAATDTVVRWTYDDVQFAFLVALGRDLLVQTRVRPDHDAVSSLVGELMTVAAVESGLGLPTWRDTAGDTVIFSYKVTRGGVGEAGNVLQFFFLRGRLRVVAAVPYVD